jgi:hypothetical protein
MFANARKWRKEGLREDRGVVVGSDLTQEWLLPWWWENYRRHNQYPVSFVNFGLSEEKKKWCQERGELIPLYVADIFVQEKEELAPCLIKEWEAGFGNRFWDSRKAWFKKPLACLASPYRQSIWIDLDCEIRGSLEPLFDFAKHPSGLALTEERPDGPTPIATYNSGVIVFQRGIELIEEWADASFERNGDFRGDQELLSQLIADKGIFIGQLPSEYNWSRYYGDAPEALIYHWHGEFGRSVIRHQMSQAER